MVTGWVDPLSERKLLWGAAAGIVGLIYKCRKDLSSGMYESVLCYLCLHGVYFSVLMALVSPVKSSLPAAPSVKIALVVLGVQCVYGRIT